MNAVLSTPQTARAISAAKQDPSDMLVISTCCGAGFPVGLATSQSIAHIALALFEAGVDARVLHCGPHPYLPNVARTGNFKGVPYRYLGAALRRPKNVLLRRCAYLTAYLELALRLAALRLRHPRLPMIVLTFGVFGSFHFALFTLCRVLRIPIVVECCEWPVELPNVSTAKRWLYKHVFPHVMDGALVISKELQDRIANSASLRRLKCPVYRRPVLIDPQDATYLRTRERPRPNVLVWCGDLWGYNHDVTFLIRVVAKLNARGQDCFLHLIGPANAQARASIARTIEGLGLDPDRVVIKGYLARKELLSELATATVLMQPMSDDLRSRARFPNKLGEYLLAARPVLTSPIGEVREYLSDNRTAVFYEADNEESCTRAVIRLLGDPELGNRIGRAGRQVALDHFSYKVHGPGLVTLFREVLAVRAHSRAIRSEASD